MHPLDNPIWKALNTRQAHFAESRGKARRFIPEVSPLAAIEEETLENYEALRELVPAGIAVLFSDHAYQPQQGWEYVRGAAMPEMVSTNGISSTKSSYPMVDLGAADSPEMNELTHLTKPGPFNSRTHELGNYVGIRQDGKLVAMAGERLQLPGYTEVSAVCTHPEHTGKGYAAVLMAEVMRRIRDRGETPILHVRQDNTRAIDLYQRLGFVERKVMYFHVLKRM